MNCVGNLTGFFFFVPGETNNGIKKEGVAKDSTKIWGNEGIKAPNFSHSLVNKTLVQCQWKIEVVKTFKECHSLHASVETSRNEGRRRSGRGRGGGAGSCRDLCRIHANEM